MGRRTVIAAGAVAAIGMAAALLQPTSPEATRDSARAAIDLGAQALDQLGPAVSSYLLQIDCTIPPTVLPCRDPVLAEQLITQGGRAAVTLHTATQIANAPAWDEAQGERAITAVHDTITRLHTLTASSAFKATASRDAVAAVDNTAAQVKALPQ